MNQKNHEPQPINNYEAERKPKVFVAYRNNDFFVEFVPKIINDLKRRDIPVETKIFPKGTPDEEIKKWAEENRHILTEKELILDATIRRNLGSTNDLTVKKSKQGGSSYLDSIFEEVSGRAILGSEFLDKIEEGNMYRERKSLKERTDEERWELTKSGFQEIMRNLIEANGEQPDQIILVIKKLADHDPFTLLWQDKLPDKKKPYIRFEETREQYGDPKAVEIIAEWLKELGISEDKIIKANDINTELIDKSNNFVILDRHTKLSFQPNHSKVLKMPMPNLWESARKYGLKIEPDKLNDELQKVLDRDFEEKDQKSLDD